MRKRKPKIFISSTVFDLEDARGALKHLLERDYGLTVYSSETPDFPIMSNKHSYDICLERLKECDLVIALIDKRYGGTYEMNGKTPISVTRKELRVAQEKNIPVWTFVRTETWDERKKFKDFAKANRAATKKRLSDEQLFQEFKSSYGSRVDSNYVFDFIDEVTRFKKSNWIFNQFGTSFDLLMIIGQQFIHFLQDFYSNNLLFVGTNEVFEMPEMFQQYLSRVGKYKDANLMSLSIYMRLMTEGASYMPRAIIELQDIGDRVFNNFIKDFDERANDALARRNRSSKIFITDTTMETVNPDVWRNSKYHRKIIEASERLATKYNLRYVKYLRVLVLFEPHKALADQEWIKSLDFLIRFHKRTGIKLGLCWRIVLPSQFDDRLLNFYLIPNELVALWDPTSVMAFEFNKRQSSRIVGDFTELYEMILESCNRKHGGFWVEKNMTINDAIKEIASLMDSLAE
ncbi:MAG TPA: DUF4062 domain-containing protein [Pyrinomonadaceae bacterium]|jgi:nucleoside 2-deoxyribosyltransferase